MAGATQTIVVNVPPEQFAQVISDYERYPEFLSEMEAVKVLERNGDAADVEFTLNLIKRIRYVLRLTTRGNTGLDWTLVEGMFKRNEGGWTLILRNDMKNDLDPGWDPPDLSVCGSWGTMLGGYELTSDEEITNDLFMGGVPHNQLHVSMTYAAIDKWNGDTGYVELDGTAIFDEAIDNSDSADGQVCGSEGGGNNTKDSQHSVDAIVGHTSESVLIVAGSTLNGSASAASFGIDEVEVWIR